MTDVRYLAGIWAGTPLEMAMRVAAGEFRNKGCFERHMAARAYRDIILHTDIRWGTDWQASEWLKQYEEVP